MKSTRKTVNYRSSLAIVFFGLLIAIVISPANGQGVVKPEKAPVKYAVVDMQTVILNVTEGKNARAKLEKEIKAKESELMEKKKELDKMNKDWTSQAPLLSESARFEKQKEFQEKFLALRNEEMEFQKEIKAKEQRATQKIAMAVTGLVDDLAKQRGYEMVFETNSAGLLYLKEPLDLTKEVIAAYEVKSKSEKSEVSKTAKGVEDKK
ncbi:MAG: OmpH family outer membrane protein [Oligoflexales bacterium]|nr:OmpH family outer membrane protein [Oligoflexales bacterium]